MELTEVENRMLDNIRNLGNPTTREAGSALGYTNAGALYVLRKLEEKGAVRSHQTGPGRALEWEAKILNAEEPVPEVHHGKASMPPPPKPLVGREAVLDEYVATTVDLERLKAEHVSTLTQMEQKLSNLRAQLLGQVLPPQPAPRTNIARSTQNSIVDTVAHALELNGPMTIHELAERCDLETARARGAITSLLRTGRARRREEDGRYGLVDGPRANPDANGSSAT